MAGNPVEDFIARVVPWPQTPEAPGLINLHYTRPSKPGMAGRPFRSISEFMSRAQWSAANPVRVHDVYFCLSSQISPGKVYNGQAVALRNQQNVLALKAIWFDIDVKPGRPDCYQTPQEALDALLKFIANNRLPPISALVASGSGGFHVYWISDKPLSKDAWQPYAEGLWALAQKDGFKADPVTTDAARVLRVPGTFNFKHNPPRPAVLKALAAADIDFAQALGHIKLTGTVSAGTSRITPQVALYDEAALPQRAPLPAGAPSLADGIHIHDDTPLDYGPLLQYCGHFQDAIRTGGKDYDQGLWMMDVLLTTFLQDGRAIAHKVSEKYPTYSAVETDKMIERKTAERAQRGLGWPSCTAFENAGSTKCAACPFKGKIKSPLNLAAQASAPIHPIAPPPPPIPNALCLPVGYLLTETGFVGKHVEKVLNSNETVQEVMPFFRCRIRDPELVEGPRGLTLEAETSPGVWKKILIRDTVMGDDRSLIRAFWEVGINVVPTTERWLREFMSAWIHKLEAEIKRVQSIPFGWVWDATNNPEDVVNANIKPAGFAYAGRIYRENRQDHPAGVPNKQMEEVYCVRGNPQPWRDVMKLITDQKRYDLQVIVALSFAAPLIAATGQYACVLSAFSPRSGAHKTTAVRAGLAVWACPQGAKESLDASEKGITKKMGELKSLPLYWDEISDEEAAQKGVHVASKVTEGAEGSKLNPQRDFHLRGMWQNLIAICGNMCLWDIANQMNKTTDAKMRRIFEIKVVPIEGNARSSEVDQMLGYLDHNHGHMGKLYAEYLGHNVATVFDRTMAWVREFEDTLKHGNQDRFWIAMCGCLMAGADLANQVCGAGFMLPDMAQYLCGEFRRHKEKVDGYSIMADTEQSVSELFGMWIKEQGKNQLWVKRLPRGRSGGKGVDVLYGPERENTINILWARDDNLVRISQSKFVEFAEHKKFQKTALFASLRDYWSARLNIHRQNLSAYCGYPNAAETVIEIPVPNGHELASNLYLNTPIAERPADTAGAPLTAPVSSAPDAAVITQAFANAANEAAQISGMTGSSA